MIAHIPWLNGNALLAILVLEHFGLFHYLHFSQPFNVAPQENQDFSRGSACNFYLLSGKSAILYLLVLIPFQNPTLLSVLPWSR